MCGLAGLFILPDSPQPLPDFNLALSAMKHRGPDDEGFLAFNTVTTANSVKVGEDFYRRLTCSLPSKGSPVSIFLLLAINP